MEQATLLREEFGGHTAEWYFEEIMQRARMSKSKRSASRWNAFLRSEVKSINDGDVLVHSWIKSNTQLKYLQPCQPVNVVTRCLN
jgi:hypothetical protein